MATGKSWEQAWAEQGGWKSVLTNVGIGLIGSVGGEVSDIAKANKEIKAYKDIVKYYGESIDNLDNATIEKVAKKFKKDYEAKKTNWDYFAYETQRKEYIEQCINNLKREEKLKQYRNLQNQINNTGAKVKNYNVGKAAMTVLPLAGVVVTNKCFKRNIKNNINLTNKVSTEGMIHFTSSAAADAILSSGYIKKSGIITSYGKKSTFFFAGIPSVGDVALNLSTTAEKLTAVKIMPSDEVINKLKYRYKDDKALLWRGNFNFKDMNLEAKKCYYVLKEVNNKLEYVEVSKKVFDNYDKKDKTIKQKFISAMYTAAVAYSHQYDLVWNNTKSHIGSMKSVFMTE